MDQCITNGIIDIPVIGFLIHYIVGFSPLILATAAGFLAYKGVNLYALWKEGYVKIKATFIKDDTRSGFSFDYKGSNYFVDYAEEGKSAEMGVYTLLNGKKYSVYISPKNPKNLFVYKSTMAAWNIVAMVVAILVFCGVVNILMTFNKVLC